MDASVPKARPITVAILALGGEGGGVLADWIVDLAQHGGYLAQTTSIPGVAQRTGATIYYVELFPKAAAQAVGRDPVLSLVPMPGDVDVVLASELMEAARAVERGFVTPDKTRLIASTHRVFAMTEKIALADGRADAAALTAACQDAAREFIAFDMAAIADATGSVLSAVLFGALAGSGALPFQRMAFEAAIRRARVGSTAAWPRSAPASRRRKMAGPLRPKRGRAHKRHRRRCANCCARPSTSTRVTHCKSFPPALSAWSTTRTPITRANTWRGSSRSPTSRSAATMTPADWLPRRRVSLRWRWRMKTPSGWRS